MGRPSRRYGWSWYDCSAWFVGVITVMFVGCRTTRVDEAFPSSPLFEGRRVTAFLIGPLLLRIALVSVTAPWLSRARSSGLLPVVIERKSGGNTGRALASRHVPSARNRLRCEVCLRPDATAV